MSAKSKKKLHLSALDEIKSINDALTFTSRIAMQPFQTANLFKTDVQSFQVVTVMKDVAPSLQTVIQPVQTLAQALQPVIQPIQTVVQALQPVIQPIETVALAFKPVIQPMQTVVQAFQPAIQPMQTLARTFQAVDKMEKFFRPMPSLARVFQPRSQAFQGLVKMQELARATQAFTVPFQTIAQSLQANSFLNINNTNSITRNFHNSLYETLNNFDNILNNEPTNQDYAEFERVSAVDIQEFESDLNNATEVNENWQHQLIKLFNKWKDRNPVFACVLVYIFLPFLICVVYDLCKASASKGKVIRDNPNSQSNIIYSLQVEQNITIINSVPYYYGIEFFDENSESKTGWISKRSVRIMENNKSLIHNENN